ncbi:MAG TPA: hypothetical protein VL651_05115, partial [Bacteroidia bacterium]|nr:hypothetical protein [Bacteroidia bacterium]
DFNSSSVNQIDYRFLMNSGTYLSFFIEFYSEATAAHVSTDHRVAPLLFDMKRKCWINKDSLFYPSVDTLINSITDSLQQEDGYAPFFEGIALQKDTVVFYIGRNWPNHSFTEEYYFNTSALKEYYRDPYCKRFTGHKQKQFPALPEDPD